MELRFSEDRETDYGRPSVARSLNAFHEAVLEHCWHQNDDGILHDSLPELIVWH